MEHLFSILLLFQCTWNNDCHDHCTESTFIPFRQRVVRHERVASKQIMIYTNLIDVLMLETLLYTSYTSVLSSNCLLKRYGNTRFIISYVRQIRIVSDMNEIYDKARFTNIRRSHCKTS